MVVLLLVLASALPGGAWAHAALVASEPADGASLTEAPAAVVLRFDEAVTLLGLGLAGPGSVVALAPQASGPVIRAMLPPGLGSGTYLVSFRVVSADGHPVAGTLAFGIGMAPAATPVAGAAAPWVPAAGVLRGLLYLGFAIGAGGALFRALVATPPPAVLRRMGWASGLGLAAALLGLGVQGGGMLAAPSFLALLQGATWGEAARSSAWARGLVVALGLAVVALSCRLPGRAGRAAGLASALVAASGLSLSGHAATGGWLSHALLVAHAATAAFWLGALLPLAALLRQQGFAALLAVRRFAGLAMPAVAVLLLTGVAQAALHLPDPAALLGTTYGLLLLAKAAGAAALLLLAAVNHWRLTPALAAGAGGAARHLVRGIGAEMAVGAAVLAATAALTMTSPHAGGAHRHAAAAPPGPAVATEAGGLAMVLQVAPAHPGQNRITLHVTRRDGTPLASPGVWLELAQPQAGVAGLRRRMQAEAPGRFVLDGPELAVPGRWSFRAEILVSDFEQVSATLRADVAPPP